MAEKMGSGGLYGPIFRNLLLLLALVHHSRTLVPWKSRLEVDH